MRRVANGHPSALVIERCQPGSRFTWWGVPVRGKIPADCIHTHAYARTIPPEISFWPDTQASSALFKLCLFLSLSVFLTCLLPLARLPDFALSVLLAVLCLSPYIIFCLSQTLPLSVSLFSSPPPLSLYLSLNSGGISGAVHLCAVSVL